MNSLWRESLLILRNDLRLFWRDMRSGKARMFSGTLILGLAFVLFQGVAILLFLAAKGASPPLIAETVVWFFFAFIMLGASVNNAVTVLFERADFDLLLSSPVSPASILVARLVALMTAAAASIALFFIPIVNGAAIGLSPRYLSAYVVWLLVAAIATCCGISLTLVLVRWLGPRRARIWAQVLGGVLGALVYIGFQAQNMLRDEMRAKVGAVFENVFGHPVAGIVPRAGRGEPLPLLLVAGVAALGAFTTVRLLGKVFVSGIQDAGSVHTPRKRGRHYRFRDGLILATFRKDARLIVRDPLLLSRVLPSVLYLLPLAIPTARFESVGMTGVLASVSVIIAVMLSSQLAAIAASGEEGWDLIRLSPASTVTLRIAKIAAGMALPMAVCAVIAVAVAFMGRPGLALFSLVTSLVCAAGSCWLEVAVMQPTPRKDLLQSAGRGRVRFSPVRLVAGFVFVGLGTASVALAAAGMWLLTSVALGVVILTAIGCFTLIEMKDIEFEATTAPARRAS